MVGEGLKQRDLFAGEWFHYGPTQQEAADGPLVADERNAHGGTVAELLREIAAQWKLIAAGGRIGHMDHLLIQDGPPGHPAAPERSHRARAHRNGAVMRYSAQIIALAQEDDGVVSVAQARRRLDEGVEHRLQIECRAADHLEHIGGGGLLLQRLAKLVEQPRVLDGNDRLVREARDQLNLLVGEWPDFPAEDCNDANRSSLLNIGTATIERTPATSATATGRGSPLR